MALRVSSRYAKSLLLLATELNVVNEVNQDVNTISQDLEHASDLSALFKSPIISIDKKTSVIESLYGGKLNKVTLQFLQLLINKKREGGIKEILSSFIDQYRAVNNIGKLVIISASPLTDSVREKLTSEVKASMKMDDMIVEEKVDTSLIGGFILEYAGKRYDASVKNKLERIEASFNKNLYIENY